MMGETWQQLGIVFRPEQRFRWMQTHAQLPVAVSRGRGECRVFFAARDGRNRSSVGYVDLALPGMKVLRVSEKPALCCGPLGCFDDHGAYPSSVVEEGGRLESLAGKEFR
ncbi:MAG: glycosylase, partial [Planctomycetaceae bacterium]